MLECAEQTAENFKHMLALDERDFALSGLTDELKVRIAKEYLTEQTKQTQKCRNGFFKDIPLITRIIEWRTIRDVNKAFERFVCLVSNL